MGYEFRRESGRWTGMYELAPKVYRSAGTYDTRREAAEAWLEIERDLKLGNYTDPAKGRWTFRQYVEEKYLPLHTGVKVNTKKNYASDLRCSVMPFFADMRLAEIYPEHVRLFVTRLERAGYAPATIRTRKAVLSAILAQAVQDRHLKINPALGVKTPKLPPQRIRAVSPADFPRIPAALPGPVSRMLVELDVHTGLRWGEITELRGRDVKDDEDDEYRVYLDVQRAVVDAGTAYTGDGARYHVENTTKSGYDRRIGLSVAMTDRLLAYIDEHGIGEDDLLFPYSLLRAEWEAAQLHPDGKSLEDMPPNLPRTASSPDRVDLPVSLLRIGVPDG